MLLFTTLLPPIRDATFICDLLRAGVRRDVLRDICIVLLCDNAATYWRRYMTLGIDGIMTKIGVGISIKQASKK